MKIKKIKLRSLILEAKNSLIVKLSFYILPQYLLFIINYLLRKNV